MHTFFKKKDREVAYLIIAAPVTPSLINEEQNQAGPTRVAAHPLPSYHFGLPSSEGMSPAAKHIARS